MKGRIRTAVLGGALFLFLLCMGGWYWVVGTAIMALVSYDEWMHLQRLRRTSLVYIVGLATLLLVVYGWEVLAEMPMALAVPVLLLLLLPVLTANRIEIADVSHALLGSLYIGLGLAAILSMRNDWENGLALCLFIVLATWANDTFAYLIGKKWGKTKLLPKISPNKTVEGSLAGVVAAVVVALGYALIMREPLWLTLCVGVLIGVIGQVGDLMESAVKRSFKVKDTGRVLPGHGGFLDRFDGLIVVFPAMYLMWTIWP